MKYRYICENSADGILTGVYDAWRKQQQTGEAELLVEQELQTELFCEEIYVHPDPWKARKVADSVKRRISGEAYRWVFLAAASEACGKADAIFRFLLTAFQVGEPVTRMLYLKEVQDLRAIARQVERESHKWIEFLRFQEIQGGILTAVFEPKAEVALMLAPHFEDRMPSENWIIYDRKRKQAVVHPAERPFYLTRMQEETYAGMLNASDGETYENLWRSFFDSIGIRDRKNPRCQRTMLPLYCRKNMTEFTERSDQKKV